MMKQFSMYLLAALLFVQCQRNEPIVEHSEEEDASISFLALGDSYTICEGISEAGRWPNQLIDSLATQNIEIDSLRIIATTGWTTTNLQNAIDNSEIEEYNLVSLLIGVNNQYQGLDEQNFPNGIRLSFTAGYRVFSCQ